MKKKTFRMKKKGLTMAIAGNGIASGAWTKIALTMDKITSTMAEIASTRSGFALSKAGFVLTKAQVASSYANEISQLPIQNCRSAISSRPFHR
jgi:hypothetical protein